MPGRPGEECPAEDLLGNDPLYFCEGVDGSSVKLVLLENYTYQAIYVIKSSTVHVRIWVFFKFNLHFLDSNSYFVYFRAFGESDQK